MTYGFKEFFEALKDWSTVHGYDDVIYKPDFVTNIIGHKTAVEQVEWNDNKASEIERKLECYRLNFTNPPSVVWNKNLPSLL